MNWDLSRNSGGHEDQGKVGPKHLPYYNPIPAQTHLFTWSLCLCKGVFSTEGYLLPRFKGQNFSSTSPGTRDDCKKLEHPWYVGTAWSMDPATLPDLLPPPPQPPTFANLPANLPCGAAILRNAGSGTDLFLYDSKRNWSTESQMCRAKETTDVPCCTLGVCWVTFGRTCFPIPALLLQTNNMQGMAYVTTFPALQVWSSFAAKFHPVSYSGESSGQVHTRPRRKRGSVMLWS